jgi:RND family efflux transporter MFP subunit
VPRIALAYAAAASLAVAVTLAGCNQKAAFTPPPPPKVTVASPLVQPVQPNAEFTGQTSASQSVDLVARVSGFLREIQFKDGADVEKGQALFVIEPDQYKAQVDLAQATLEQHQATLKAAEAEFIRQETLQKQAISTEANYDKALANRDAERAAVAQAQANLKIAQINLSYTSVEAPFAGRLGRRQVDVGNLVGDGSPTKLATISDISTIYVYFTVNERDLLRLRGAMAENKITRDTITKIPVYAGLANETGTPHEGRLDFVDSGLDATTGTIQARAVFDNPTKALIPGLYVRLRIPAGPEKPGTLVPDSAVSMDQSGAYLMVVDGKGGVATRRVTLGPQQGGLRVVASGLEANDKVVIDGLQNATPGRPVTVVDGTFAAAAKS